MADLSVLKKLEELKSLRDAVSERVYLALALVVYHFLGVVFAVGLGLLDRFTGGTKDVPTLLFLGHVFTWALLLINTFRRWRAFETGAEPLRKELDIK